MATITVNKFHGAIADDIRQDSGVNVYSATHFDLWTNPYRATPFHSMIAADATSGSNLRNFLLASTGTFYGIGISPGTSKMRLFSTTTDWASFSSWNTVATSATATQVTTGAGGFNTFIEYKDYLYGVHGAGLDTIWRYGPLSSSPSYTENYTASGTITAGTYTRCSNMIVGSDDNLYFAVSNATSSVLMKITASHAVAAATYVPPAGNQITCLANYGSYLAVGFINTTSETSIRNQQSVIKMWNYVSSDSSDSIICPDGALVTMGNVDGQLITVQFKFRTGFGSARNTYIGIVNGALINIFKVLPNVTPTSSRSQVYSGNLYFGGLHSTDYKKTGIYAAGRPTSQYPWGVNMEYSAVANGSTTNPTAVNGFYLVDDYMWVSHSTDNVTKIDNSGTYLNSSIIETLVNPNMPLNDRTADKTLNAVQIMCPTLPSGGSIILSVSTDGGTYQDCSPYTITGGLGDTFTQSTSGPFSGGLEFQFKVVSTGGAEITGIIYRYTTNPAQT